jgi:hypothetical protein
MAKNPHAVHLGRLGGLVKSEAKAKAARRNGRLGGKLGGLTRADRLKLLKAKETP